MGGLTSPIWNARKPGLRRVEICGRETCGACGSGEALVAGCEDHRGIAQAERSREVDGVVGA